MNKIFSMETLSHERRLELSNTLIILFSIQDQLVSIIKDEKNIVENVLSEDAVKKVLPLLSRKKKIREQVSRTANRLFHNLYYINPENHATIIAGKQYTDAVIKDSNIIIEKTRKLLPSYIVYA